MMILGFAVVGYRAYLRGNHSSVLSRQPQDRVMPGQTESVDECVGLGRRRHQFEAEQADICQAVGARIEQRFAHDALSPPSCNEATGSTARCKRLSLNSCHLSLQWGAHEPVRSKFPSELYRGTNQQMARRNTLRLFPKPTPSAKNVPENTLLVS
jgi:hypothetical protein